MFGSNCCFLTCIQISQEAGQMVWYSHLFKNFPKLVVIHTINAFSVVNEAEVDFFLEFSCLFYDPTKIMASSPITSWQIDGETVETVADFILGGSKITADADCSHEIKRCLLLGRKVMNNLLLSRFSRVRLCATPQMAAHQAPPSLGLSRQSRQHIKKQRRYFVNKSPSSQGYGFSSSHV